MKLELPFQEVAIYNRSGYKTNFIATKGLPKTSVITKGSLTTVRIMAVSLKAVDSNEILVVSTLNGAKDDMQKIRIYLKSEAWGFKTLEIATEFYKRLVKYRLLLKKKVYDKHLYQIYNDLKLLYATQDLPFASVRQLYIANLKAPSAVLKKPRSGYKEVKSDTYRLWAINESLRIEKERLKAIKENRV